MASKNSTINTTFTAKDQMSASVNTMRKNVAALGGPKFGPLGNLASGLTSMSSPALLAAAGIGIVSAALGDSIQNAIDEQKNIALLNASLKANIPNWDGNTDAIERNIAMNEQLAFSDDDQRAAMGQLVTRTHDVSKAQDLMRDAMDLARLKGIDLASAVGVLGKVYDGSYTSAIKMGVAIKKGSTSAEALAQIQQATSGQAAAYAATTAGQFQTLNIELQDLSENVGDLLLGPLTDLVSWANHDIIPAFQHLLDEAGQVGVQLDNLDKIVDSGRAGRDALTAQTQAQADALGLTVDQYNALILAAANADPAQKTVTDNMGHLTDATWLLNTTIHGISTSGFAILPDLFNGLTGSTTNLTTAYGLYGDTVAAQLPKLRADATAQAAMALALQGVGASITGAIGTIDASKSKMEAESNAFFSMLPSAATDAAAEVQTIMAGIGPSIHKTIDDGRKEAQAGMNDLLWAMDHPKAGKRYEDDIADMIKRAEHKRRVAQREGNTVAVGQADLLLTDLTAKYNAIAGLGGIIKIGVTTLGIGGMGGGHGSAGIGHRAMGGYTAPGASYIVGERGPEVLTMGGQPGSITPNGASEPPRIIQLVVDGRVLAQVVDEHQGRTLATTGMAGIGG